MRKITLVFTAHRENGLCNVGELVMILRSLEPQVIFEETHPSDFDSYYKHGTKRKLEAQAIKRYSELRVFNQVPVDRYDMPGNLFVESQKVFAFVAQTTEEYVALDEQNAESVFRLGFSYLNSAACAAVMDRLSDIEEKVIREAGDQALIRALNNWRHFMQKREREMVSNIYEYCGDRVFDAGVFLVGVAHRTNVVKEIDRCATIERDLIDWKFFS